MKTDTMNEWPAERFPTTPYPGVIPNFSYVMDRGRVRRLACRDGAYELADGVSLHAWLAHAGDDHVPILIYGSNACPGRLIEKFPACAGHGIALLRGRLQGAVRVWSRNVSSTGSVPMTLAAQPSAESEAHLMLLPHRLAEKMDASEGRGGPYYALARLPTCRLLLDNGTVWERPLAYVGHSLRGPLLRHREPVVDTSLSQEEVKALIANGEELGGDMALPPMNVVDAFRPLIDSVDPVLDGSLMSWIQPEAGPVQ